ncbi:hypothetical protein JTB14_006806 [Gonioctena quinquepunctata]|nr:hypothetical protein JTB14_006806 [Gonioctena quinquepunctata]
MVSIISRVNKAASVLKMSSRSKRMVQAALSQPSEDIIFSETEDSQISDTDSNYIPPDDLASNISEFSSIDLSPLVPVSDTIFFSTETSEGALHTPPEFLPQLTLLSTSSTLVSEPTNSEVNTAIENVSKLALKKRIRRKHTCPFCNLKCGNFSRHLERNHEDETSVQEFLCLDKTSTKRKKLIDKIRREGDFCTAETIPVMQQNKEPTEFILCKFCMGYYSQKCLRRHAKHCFFNPDPAKRFNAKSEGQTVMAGHFGPNDILRSSGLFSMLRADEVSMAAKKDPVICEVARRYIRRHKEKHISSKKKNAAFGSIIDSS